MHDNPLLVLMPLHHLTENEVITEQRKWKDMLFYSQAAAEIEALQQVGLDTAGT